VPGTGATNEEDPALTLEDLTEAHIGQTQDQELPPLCLLNLEMTKHNSSHLLTGSRYPVLCVVLPTHCPVLSPTQPTEAGAVAGPTLQVG
jgi:hypothetical protein